jgi:DNA primase
LRGRIVIPIHDEQGELIAYVGRAPDSRIPKYRFPKGFRKSPVRFNMHRARATGARNVIVVEGFFDTFALHHAGHPAAVGLMGSTLSQHQADLLINHFDRVFLLLDGDEAGRHGALAIAKTLTTRLPLTVISLEDGTQPDQLGQAQIQRIMSKGDMMIPSRFNALSAPT